MKKRVIATLLLAVTIFTCFNVSVFAKNKEITTCLDVSKINMDTEGSGYEWDNLERVFKMNNMSIKTSDTYGIRLPADSTVEIHGNNFITTSSFGIHCLTSLNFVGDGTLTITAPTAGIFCASTSEKDNVRFRDGKIIIKGANNGIYSENAKLSFTGSDVDVTASSSAIFGKNMQWVAGNVTLNGGIYSKGYVEISATNITVTSNECAIKAEKGITIFGEKIFAGDSSESVTEKDSYNGEKCIKLVSTVKRSSKSLLFGEKVPAVVDYIIFTVLILAAGAVIAVPLIIKHKKTAKLIALSKQNKNNTKRNSSTR